MFLQYLYRCISPILRIVGFFEVCGFARALMVEVLFFLVFGVGSSHKFSIFSFTPSKVVVLIWRRSFFTHFVTTVSAFANPFKTGFGFGFGIL